MTTTMIANEFNQYFFVFRNRYFPIDVNSTTLITLETPTAAYLDLTGQTIQIRAGSDYFWKDTTGAYPEIIAATKLNHNNQTDEISEKHYDMMLPIIEDQIHDVIGRTGDPLILGDKGYGTVKAYVLALLFRWNRRRQYNKRTNVLELVPALVAPTLSAIERADLQNATKKRTSGSFVFSMITGEEIYPI